MMKLTKSSVLARFQNNPGLLAGFLAQALQYGAGLLLMPFVVSRLSAAEVGIWYVFLTALSLATIADFGFQPTFARFFSLAYSGVNELSRNGIASTGNGSPNMPLVRSLLKASRKLYLWLSAFTLLVLISIGVPYVSDLATKGALEVKYVQLSWVIFSSAVSLNLYFMWIPSFLMGSGKVVSNYTYLIFARGGFAIFGIVVMLVGGGLLALSIGFLASQITARVLAAIMLKQTAANNRVVSSSTEINVLATIWPNASRLGLVAIGAFFITRYNIFLLSTEMGLRASASYAICFQLLSGISSVGQLPIQANVPKIVAARVDNNSPIFRKIVVESYIFYGIAYFVGAIAINLFGSKLLDIIGSKVELLDSVSLAIFTVVIALEGFHSIAGIIITTRNHVPFVIPAVLSGIAVLVLATTSVKLGYGITSVIVCQGIVQASYNNWKWPLMVYRECKD